jgi:hypothetical protein
MDVRKYGHHSTHFGGSRQQNQQAMNLHILSNLQTWQTYNENKLIDWMKKNIEIEWGQLQI